MCYKNNLLELVRNLLFPLCAGVHCKHINMKQLANKHSFIKDVGRSQWKLNSSGRQM